MALLPLKLDLKPKTATSPSTARPAADIGDTAVMAGSKPRTLDTGTVSQINNIAPGMGSNVLRGGLNSVVVLAKSNPKKAAAIATIAALGSVAGYNELTELANVHPVESVREYFAGVLAGVDNIEAKAGLNTYTPDEDGEIAGIGIDEVAEHFMLVEKARNLFKDAAAAFGGRSRLLAFEAWDSVDDDLKRIVISLETE